MFALTIENLMRLRRSLCPSVSPLNHRLVQATPRVVVGASRTGPLG
jgi:hypothetical protein